MTADFYQQALRRMFRISMALGAAGIAATLILRGPLAAGAFLLGATVSLVNLRWWISVTNAIGSSGKAPLRGSAVFLALRFLLLGGAVYVIVKLLNITPVALLAGLFVSVAAVIVEALYELIYART